MFVAKSVRCLPLWRAPASIMSCWAYWECGVISFFVLVECVTLAPELWYMMQTLWPWSIVTWKTYCRVEGDTSGAVQLSAVLWMQELAESSCCSLLIVSICCCFDGTLWVCAFVGGPSPVMSPWYSDPNILAASSCWEDVVFEWWVSGWWLAGVLSV